MDPQVKRKVLRMIPYGLFVITSRGNGNKIAAATIDWVSQSSFEPPMLVCCLRRDGFIYEVIREVKTYALHPLVDGQKDFAADFFKFKEATETHLNGHPFHLTASGIPILDEATANIELELVDELSQGDHSVMLGKVVNVQQKSEARALLLRDTGWNYGG